MLAARRHDESRDGLCDFGQLAVEVSSQDGHRPLPLRGDAHRREQAGQRVPDGLDLEPAPFFGRFPGMAVLMLPAMYLSLPALMCAFAPMNCVPSLDVMET